MQWLRAQRRVQLTDTTLRDAHQSLLATRMRTHDMLAPAAYAAAHLPTLWSLECWGGATFDVAMRFLAEDPWERLTAIRTAAPNLLTQMLLRGANGVGYTNYPDNVVQAFIKQAATGIDIFRIFDCLNWVENMRVAIDAVAETGKIAQGALCYTGDILDPNRAKYSLNYYVDLARQLEAAGCHMLAIKDMAGLLKPPAARALIRALRDITDLPIALHTHDTSGAAAATLVVAIEEGIDIVDAAIDAMSGTTSQPCLGSIVAAVAHTPLDTGLNPAAIRTLSVHYEAVRDQYAAFESDLKAGASEVYLHEMPGGQFTNLKEQARSLGLESRWHQVALAYAEANQLFGDIVKVTPSSKVVGDMALMMVTQGLSAEDVLDPSKDIAFPTSVFEMLRGDLGQPPGGWPKNIQTRVLGETPAITVRPARLLPAVDLAAERASAEAALGQTLSDQEFASHLMYPKVFAGFMESAQKFGPVSTLPPPAFFYGMEPGEELAVEIEQGKTLNIRLQAIGDIEEDGRVRLFFELNGQPRVIVVANRRASAGLETRRIADPADETHIAAPMPGVVAMLAVKSGEKVEAGALLLTLEAMKMETSITAPRAGTITDIAVKPGNTIDAKDLLLILS